MMQAQVGAMNPRVVARRVTAVAALLAAMAAGTGADAQTVTVGGTGRHIMVRPTGYLGITLSGDQKVQASQHTNEDQVVEQRVLVSYVNYPVIVSVEPGSPAARAGLVAGDTVLSYNGSDVRKPFALYDMLKPGHRLTMRVRRGSTRNVTIDVARRPSAYGAAPSAPGAVYVPTPEVSEQVRREVERAQQNARRELEQARKDIEKSRSLTTEQRRELERSAGASASAQARASLAPIAFTTASLSGVAGAEMAPMNEDLSELVGLRRGVFVVKVNPGTPADQSGLRGGDVITAVGDSAVNDVAQLRRAISREQRRIRSANSAREIPLQIVRKHKRQKVTLKF